MDRHLRILQRQVIQDTDLRLLPISLLRYISELERFARVESLLDVEVEDVEGEADMQAAFARQPRPKAAVSVYGYLCKYLGRLGLPCTFEALSTIDPLELAMSKNMGHYRVGVIANVLATAGHLTPAWLDFVVRNRLYLKGQGDPRRSY